MTDPSADHVHAATAWQGDRMSRDHAIWLAGNVPCAVCGLYWEETVGDAPLFNQEVTPTDRPA